MQHFIFPELRRVGRILLCCALFIPSILVEAAPRTYKFAYQLPIDSQLGAGGVAFAEEVKLRSGGRIRIEQAPNTDLGSEVDMLAGVQLGTIDFAIITGAALSSFVPDVGIFAIPFLFRDKAHAYAVFDGPVGKAYEEKFSAKGVIGLAWGENGLRHMTNSKRPIRTPDDLRGLKIRVPQSEVMITGLKAFGADVQALPFPQLYDALQAGRFDGEENAIATILTQNYSRVQKYLTLTGHVYDPCLVMVSKYLWDDLSPADRAIFQSAAVAAAKATRSYSATVEQSGVAQLKSQGMDVVEQIDRQQFAAMVKPLMPDFAKTFGADNIAAIQAAK